MEFDKSKVYTVLNADELKVSSKVIVGDNLLELKECVLKHRLPKIIKKVEPEDSEDRFLCDDGFHYVLAYLVSEPEEKKLKWTDLKIGDVIRHKNSGIEYMITGFDKRDTGYHIYLANEWISDTNLKKYEKVEEQK
jgi:hypothetical protein